MGGNICMAEIKIAGKDILPLPDWLKSVILLSRLAKASVLY